LGWTGDGGSNPIIGTPTGNNIVTWNNFDIGSGGASVTFTQDGGWILNNVQAADAMATGINGGLFGPDCGIIVVNPLGIVFGPQALVSAKNFVGSSLNISDDDFINGNFNFTGGGVAGDVINNGRIITQDMAALIGKNVFNRGIIRATNPGGHVIMAAGDQVILGQEGSSIVVEVAMADPDAHLVDNDHDVEDPPTIVGADHVVLAAGDVWSTAIGGVGPASVETLTVEAQGDAVFTGPIHVSAVPSSDAVADVTIHTGGDFTVDHAITAVASAGGGSSAIANIEIDAGGNVNIGDVVGARAVNIQSYPGSGNADATVGITAGGNVTVGGEAGVYAEARIINMMPLLDNGPVEPPVLGDATAVVDIDAGGVLAVGGAGEVHADASVEYHLGQFESGASLLLEPIPEPDSGDATASIDIDAYQGVIVADGGEIVADAWIQNPGLIRPDVIVMPTVPGNASASVDIQTCGDVIVNDLIGAYASILSGVQETRGLLPASNADASVTIQAFGNVIVNKPPGVPPADEVIAVIQPGPTSNGRIDAIASGASQTNSGDITIQACSNVVVNDGTGRSLIYEEMRAAAEGGYTNSSHLGIATLEGDVIISGQVHAHSASAIGEGSENISNIEICAGRDLTVTGGTKYIFNGTATATVAPFDQGGQIMADSHNGFFNTANIDIYAGRDVTVEGADVVYVGPLPKDDIGSCGGQIVATAQNGFENTAGIGIYAQRDVTIGAADVIGPGPTVDLAINGGSYGGQVLAIALDGVTSSAEVDICAQEDVTVDGTVRAVAQGRSQGDSADVTISAGSLIDGIGYISAQADLASILLRATDLDNILIGITPGHFNIEPDVEIGDVDCPECDFEWIDWSWCEECEEEVPAALAAPLYVQELPEIEGCPVLMEAVALELGIPVETLQVYIANALATNPNIQPCEMCARLVNSAAVLRDAGGMAALAQVVNEFVTTPAPPSEEQMTSIATAFADHTADRTHYAAGGQWIDALDQYIGILTAEMYYSTGEATAFADQYIAPIRDMGNESLTAFVEARLAALGG
jgi:filamentous hemagglutinin family protein